VAQDNWGGARTGAGRPWLGTEPTQAIHLSLPPSTLATLSQLGHGNISAGIRVLVDAWERGELETPREATPARPQWQAVALGDQVAFRIVEATLAVFLVIFAVVLLRACLYATIWTFPGAVQPAPTWTYLPLAADLFIIGCTCWVMVRRFIRRRPAAVDS
jgi:hypothetical protein